MNNRRGTLYVVSAPSGTGKDTVVRELLARDASLAFSVSATTRQPRPGEIDGVDYYFVSDDEFAEMVRNGEFLEYAHYTSASYGTPARAVDEALAEGRDIFLVIEVVGAANVRAARADAVLVYIVPPSLAELEKRLRGRGTETDEQIAARLDRAREELREIEKYDYIVVNDTVAGAVADFEAIVRAERLKREKCIDAVKNDLV